MERHHILHLDDHEDISPIALPGQLRQTPDVLGTPQGGGVGKGADAVMFQGAALDFQETGPAVLCEGEIEPGIPVNGFRPKVLQRPQAAGEEPFLCRRIGGLGIHVDEPPAFLHGDEVVFGFSVGVAAALAPDCYAGDQQFPAPAGVFDMADLFLSVDLNVGHKPVGPLQKYPGDHVFVCHGMPSFFFSG